MSGPTSVCGGGGGCGGANVACIYETVFACEGSFQWVPSGSAPVTCGLVTVNLQSNNKIASIRVHYGTAGHLDILPGHEPNCGDLICTLPNGAVSQACGAPTTTTTTTSTTTTLPSSDSGGSGPRCGDGTVNSPGEECDGNDAPSGCGSENHCTCDSNCRLHCPPNPDCTQVVWPDKTRDGNPILTVYWSGAACCPSRGRSGPTTYNCIYHDGKQANEGGEAGWYALIELKSVCPLNSGTAQGFVKAPCYPPCDQSSAGNCLSKACVGIFGCKPIFDSLDNAGKSDHIAGYNGHTFQNMCKNDPYNDLIGYVPPVLLGDGSVANPFDYHESSCPDVLPTPTP